MFSRWLVCFIVLLAFGCRHATVPVQSEEKKAIAPSKPKAPKEILNDSTISIAAVGDVMLGTSYPDSAALPPDSARGTFKHVAHDLKSADIVFGNLEGVLLDSGAPVDYKLHMRSKSYLFRMPEKYAGVLKQAGFNLLSVGNNHSNDFGKAGRDRTIALLDSLGIGVAGFRTHPSKIVTHGGVRYGFCAFSPNSQTVPMLQTGYVKSIIADLKAKSDIVIVSFHGGGEGTDFEHVRDSTEKFRGENRGNVLQFAHAAVDAGADLVLGHGPHVVRGMELYKERLIAYSLGNFATYKGVSISGICGLAPLLKVKLSKQGKFLNGQICSYRQAHASSVLPDTLNRAAARIKYLTEADFTKPGITITQSGKIMPVISD
ncbi:CapA family protein [Mucilaginibacter sp.]|uniref:CapA family protein n=1 Tax=Mucilaginibacter sp. TaxID=1882438 RepID=UPI000CB48D17|nr:CapA family protein [Mucilaginibacter sp.]PLW89396.1 MAG: capsule biosynthesis protein CapA [Mucilaginibacter sp.]HEK20846.1 CapA family protein [Bacteroidota bacterium]